MCTVERFFNDLNPEKFLTNRSARPTYPIVLQSRLLDAFSPASSEKSPRSQTGKTSSLHTLLLLFFFQRPIIGFSIELSLQTSMLTPKAFSKVVELDEYRFMVTGGSNYGVLSRETEIYDARSGRFTRGPDLPKPIAKHCAAKVLLKTH